MAAHLLGRPFRLTISAAKALALAHVFWEYGYSLGPAEGPSMLPTFQVDGEWLLTSKRHRRGRSLTVGDLVVFRIPIFPDTDGVKRVIGLPGDYVLIGTPPSSGPHQHGTGGDGMIQVPQGHCWLVGDNLPASRDSRTYGPVPLALIRGKVIAKMWPFEFIRNPLSPPSQPSSSLSPPPSSSSSQMS